MLTSRKVEVFKFGPYSDNILNLRHDCDLDIELTSWLWSRYWTLYD